MKTKPVNAVLPSVVILFSLLFTLKTEAQQVNYKGTLVLSEKSIGLDYKIHSNNSIIGNEPIYDRDLNQIARKLNDSCTLNIDLRKNEVAKHMYNGTIMYFTDLPNTIHHLLKKSEAKRTNETGYDSILYADILKRRVYGAVLQKERGYMGNADALATSCGVIQDFNGENLYTQHVLIPKRNSYIRVFKLDPKTCPDTTQFDNFENYLNADWQQFELESPKPLAEIKLPSTEGYPSFIKWKTDHEQFFGFRYNGIHIWNKQTGNWIDLGDLSLNWTIIKGGYLLYTKQQSETIKKDEITFTTIVVYDLKAEKELKTIVLPGKKIYEVHFSEGNLVAVNDRLTEEENYNPFLFNVETGMEVGKIQIPSLKERGFVIPSLKRGFSPKLIKFSSQAGIDYRLMHFLFSKDLKKLAIYSFADFGVDNFRGAKLVINGKERAYEEWLDIYSIE